MVGVAPPGSEVTGCGMAADNGWPVSVTAAALAERSGLFFLASELGSKEKEWSSAAYTT